MSRRWIVDGAFGVEHLTLEDQPEPAAPGPGQCVISMRAWSLNYRDLLMVRGQYDPRLALPYVPLSDGVGVVEAVGEGVRRVAVGDRVCPTFSPTWLDGPPNADAVRRTRGGPVPGVLAERLVLGEAELVKVPPHLTDAEAAALPCAGVTAYSAVVVVGRVAPGQRVLVIGSGGVSTFAALIARMCGARVAAVSRSVFPLQGRSGLPAKSDALRALGVEHWVSSVEEPRWGRAIRRWSDGGVDLVVEVGGAGTLEQSLDAVRVGGTVAVIGNLAGSKEPLSVLPILMKAVRCQGVFVGHRRSFEGLCDALAVGGTRPPVHAVYPFEAAPAAFEAFATGDQVGKVCITVA
jgi:NADPH:quinone reductase-like Zn-dependent oxidoreductase